MSRPLITLTTDFGPGSHYVAAMKGVILSLNPQANIIDLSHSIPPQDIATGRTSGDKQRTISRPTRSTLR